MAKEIRSLYQEKMKDPRFSETELELLKKLDEETLKVFRSVFYQDELDVRQRERLKVLTPDLVKIVRKFFIHDLDWREPLFGQPNRWDMPRFDALLMAEVPNVVRGRQRAIKFLEKGIERLESIANGGTGEPSKIEIDLRMVKPVTGTSEEIKEEVVAMQDAIKFLESALGAMFIYTMSEDDKKALQEQIRKNSAK